MRVVLDIETERLLNPEKIWVVVCRDIDNPDSVYTFMNVHENPTPLREFLENVEFITGHNVTGFDIPVLEHHHVLRKNQFTWDKVCDTICLSRLLNQNIKGGHSLEVWGERLGFPKIEFKEFDKLSPEMVEYCINDTLVSLKLYERLRKYAEHETFKKALWLEQEASYFCNELKTNGFPFDLDRAKKLLNEISNRVYELEESFKRDFKPHLEEIRRFKPKVTKSGNVSKVGFKKLDDESIYYVQDGKRLRNLEDVKTDKEVIIYKLVKFNPLSEKIVIDTFWEYGWKPVNRTKKHEEAVRNRWKGIDKEKRKRFERYGWKLDEENIATLPDTAPKSAQNLGEYLILSSRKTLLESWIELSESANDKRIHGEFLHIGTWTHRMAHRNPNMGNVPSHGMYGKEFRSLWSISKDNDNLWLVGTDADGIQMRMFCHYTEDERLRDVITSGEDIHNLHAEYLGGVDRDRAKRFIYSFLLGAGIKKIAEILGCGFKEAEERLNNFLNQYSKIQYIRGEYADRCISLGYVTGLDGRRIIIRSKRLVLAALLQSSEAIVMKLAAALWRRRLNKEGIKYEFVNFVHDEFQTLVYGGKDVAERVGKTQAKCIEEAGRRLNVFIPTTGSYSIGKTWLETH